MTPDEVPKSCDPQHLLTPPDPAWGVDELASYARTQNQAIVAGEQSLTACYWRLGLALNLARKQFAHRQWGRYLEDVGIEKTRASKARAIHGTFDKEADVAELTVHEAYRRRSQKPRVTPAEKRSSTPSPVDPVEFLLGVCRQADCCAEQVEFVEPEQARRILTVLDDTIAELDRLRGFYRVRVGA